MTRRLGHTLTWPQIAGACRAGDPLVLGVGAFEQHGGHLPMGTDFLIAEELAGALAERCAGIALPALAYGAPSRPRSGGGGDLFRAPDLPLRVLEGVVTAVARGAVEMGASRVVVLSWHVENIAVLWDALRAVPTDGDEEIVLFAAPWEFLDGELLERLTEGTGRIDWDSDHAGVLETAVMRHLRPELVGEVPAPTSAVLPPVDVFPTPPEAAPADGVLNDARNVTAEEGARCFDAMVAGMAKVLHTRGYAVSSESGTRRGDA